MWELTVPVSQIYCKQIKETYCPTVPDIANAMVVGGQTEPLPANAAVRYECLDGYKHLGSDPELMCTDNGTWTFQFFECLKIDCGRPEPVTNAIITINNGTGFAAKAEYTCHRGHYHASNQWTRTCGPDGHWTREFIECVPYGVEHCGDPPPVMDASVEIYSAQLTGLAIYTCTEGYVNFWTNSYECSETFKSWSSVNLTFVVDLWTVVTLQFLTILKLGIMRLILEAKSYTSATPVIRYHRMATLKPAHQMEFGRQNLLWNVFFLRRPPVELHPTSRTV